MVDIHNHIIFGIDDGAKTLNDSIAIAKMAEYEGIHTIIATPHFRKNRFLYPNQMMVENLKIIKNRILEEGINVDIHLGHEAYLNEYLLKELISGQCNTLAGSKYVLTEITNIDNYDMNKKMLFEIACNNFIPIIAHIERLIDEKKDCKKILDLKDMGCLLQVNAHGLLKPKRRWIRRWLLKRIKDQSISFIASDAHDTTYRPPSLIKAFQLISKKCGEDHANRLMNTNPQKIIQNSEISF